MSDLQRLDDEIQTLREGCKALVARLERRFIGQAGVVEEVVLALLAGGHVLLEGAPGLGKTTLVHELARAVDLDFKRLQCTPDLIPSDVLGARILNQEGEGDETFRFEPGPVFTNVLLADEINRATPRTQSALLEAMQEAQVTLYGSTLPLERPFFVVATQNPIEMEGTFPLPEAQLDRFLFKTTLELPGAAELSTILGRTTGVETDDEDAVLSLADIVRLQELVREIEVPSTLLDAVSRIVLATHPKGDDAPEAVRASIRYGSSLRGGQALLLAAKARALLAGRLHVAEEDLRRVAKPALRHRMIPSFEGEASGFDPDGLAEAVLGAVL